VTLNGCACAIYRVLCSDAVLSHYSALTVGTDIIISRVVPGCTALTFPTITLPKRSQND
jgi:hypothetical protein